MASSLSADPNVVTPPGAPTSPYFVIKNTPHAGRAVFAKCDIPEGTPLVTSGDCAIPVLLRPYRKEVCGWCFAYNLGRSLPVRCQDIGFSFCTPECEQKWRTDARDIGIQAWSAVESLIRKRNRKVEEDEELPDAEEPRPTAGEIKRAWREAEVAGKLIRAVRMAEDPTTAVEAATVVITATETTPLPAEPTEMLPVLPQKPSKAHRRAVQAALSAPVAVDILPFLLGGIVNHHHNPWQTLHITSLASTTRPYLNGADLVGHTRSYLALLAILPLPLLKHLTPSFCVSLCAHDAPNSFGIRSSHTAPLQSPLYADPYGDEFFGYGIWPSASYYNHSCAPNVAKSRSGRVWSFATARDIEAGEELCISYLSGEERAWSMGRRRDCLFKNWGFECACERCEL